MIRLTMAWSGCIKATTPAPMAEQITTAAKDGQQCQAIQVR